MSRTETQESVLPDPYRTTTTSPAKDRLPALDILRGLVMLLAAFVMMWPPRVIGGAGLLLIGLHNLFDGPHAAWLRDGEDAWRALHQPTFFHLGAHHVIASLYPLAPWVGVMMAGYAAGE